MRWKIIGPDADKLKVVGVVQNMKDKGDYQPVEYGMFRLMDTGSLQVFQHYFTENETRHGCGF
jgi:hypothetical protein